MVAAAGLSVWVLQDQWGTRTGRAIVQTVNGTLFEVTSAGIVPLAQGQDLPDNVEIRTAKESGAVLQLRDGSMLELKERSGFSTSQSASDLTVRLDAGSVIIQAAKRKTGHLYVDTADYRVAVTGTIFGVSVGVKGSRVSVVQGEVHVSQNNQDKILHPGEQAVSSPDLEPESVKEDISWSRDRDRYYVLLASLRAGIDTLHLPDLRYSSKILGRLPASTVFYAAIPNLAQYLGNAESVFRQKLSENPELRGVAGDTSRLSVVIDKLRAASEYLGDEIVMTSSADAEGHMQAPVFVAEVKREGFPEFLKKIGLPMAVETHNSLTVFGPVPQAVQGVGAAVDSAKGDFQGTPFYARIEAAYHEGAGLLLCADLSRMPDSRGATPALAGARYFIAEQKEVEHKMEARASLAFDSARTGLAGWLSDPAPMGSLDYVSPEATLVASFVARNPASIVDALTGVVGRKASELGANGTSVQNDLAASLGGEFTFAVDGPLMPVPSWKLVAEVYDPAKVQAALQKGVEALNQSSGKTGASAWQMSQETVDGRVYYGITGDGGPLMEAHYTFAGGYFIGGPSRALVARALQVKASGASVKHSAKFLSMIPRDHFANFSAVFYENLGTTLAPLASLMGAFSNGNEQQQKALQGLGNVKPTLIAAYGEPNSLTIASGDNVLGAGLTNLMTGNLQGLVGNVLPMAQFAGRHGR
ncbi:putative FecR [Candidatus Sulfopaludibacter sp. SbA3]|nr:putative FecR [Candidatus Sulfopaludibacter sp. SbA3]